VSAYVCKLEGMRDVRIFGCSLLEDQVHSPFLE